MRMLLDKPLHLMSISQSACILIYYLAFPSNFERSVTFNIFHDGLENWLVLILLLITTIGMIFSILAGKSSILRLSTNLTGASYGIIVMFCVKHLLYYSEPTVSLIFAISGLINVMLASAMEE